MTKNADTRLRETLTFINNHRSGDISTQEHEQIHAVLTRWNTDTPQDARHRLSALMSQENVRNRPPTKEARSYRRAAILANCVLVNTRERDWPNAVAAVNQAQGPAAAVYADHLRQARVGLYRLDAYAAPKLQDLRDHPETFLETWRLKIDGSQPPAQRHTYRFYMNQENVFNLTYNGIFGALGTAVDALTIPVTQFDDVRNNLGAMDATLSTLDNGCDLAFTTELSACCFCFAVNGGVLAAIHIQPPAKKSDVIALSTENTSGSTLATRLRAAGGFANAGGTFKVYGMRSHGWNSGAAATSAQFGYPEASRTTIMAIRIGGTWQVYSQITQGEVRTVVRLDTK